MSSFIHNLGCLMIIGLSWSANASSKYEVSRKGKTIYKAEKKQKFKFKGSQIEAEANSPAQSVIGQRVKVEQRSLIPVRNTYRNEVIHSLVRPAKL